jgi:hypothetical protein
VEVASTAVPIDTLFATSLHGTPTSKDFDETRPKREIVDFPVDNDISDDDVALFEVYNDDDEDEERRSP